MPAKKEESNEVSELHFFEKLSAIQTKIKAPKNLYNSFGKYNYRNAESILESVKPFLAEYNLYLTVFDEIVMIGDRYYVKATARLADCINGGACEVSAYARETEEKKGMDGSQVTGATSSYARKYALNGLFLLDDTKDADTDEYAKATGKAEPKKEVDVNDLKTELKDLYSKAGGADFDAWYKKSTEGKEFNNSLYASMKATLLKQISKKAEESK